MAEAVTGREFARLEGCDEKQVRRALARGLLVADAEGKLDSAQVGSGRRKPPVNDRTAFTSDHSAEPADIGADTSKNVRSSRNVRTMSAGVAAALCGAHAVGGRCRGGSKCDLSNEEINMTTFAVTAVRWDDDKLTHLLMGEVVKDGTVFSADPVERPVIDAVNRLQRGDTVVLSFPGALPGPGLCVVVEPNGTEGVETLPFDLPNKSLKDMPVF